MKFVVRSPVAAITKPTNNDIDHKFVRISVTKIGRL